MATPGITAGCRQVGAASAAYRDLLAIRTGERAFSRATAEQVQRLVSFPLSGPAEAPGVITMKAGDLVVVFNATPERQTRQVPSLAGTAYRLHPVQARGADRATATSSYGQQAGRLHRPGAHGGRLHQQVNDGGPGPTRARATAQRGAGTWPVAPCGSAGGSAGTRAINRPSRSTNGPSTGSS